MFFFGNVTLNGSWYNMSLSTPFLLCMLLLLADSTYSGIVGGLLKPWDITQTIVKDSERDVCSWKLIQPPNILIPYNMCLRSHGDVLSDEIRRVGYW